MMTTDEYNEIKKRAEAATPGPWESNHNWEQDKFTDQYAAWGESPAISGNSLSSVIPQATLDANFIAHARKDIPALLAEIDRLHAIVANESYSAGWSNAMFDGISVIDDCPCKCEACQAEYQRGYDAGMKELETEIGGEA
jgi:hypothetical protein